MDTSFLLRVAASKFPRREALRYAERRVGFAELDEAVDRLAAGLSAAGVHRAPVASLLWNDPRAVILYLALARAGATCVPINPRLTGSEIAWIVADCGAGTLIAAADLAAEHGLEAAALGVERLALLDDDPALGSFGELLGPAGAGEFEPAEPVDERDDATIIYTSGTSGFPKGAVRSHRANLWHAANSQIGAPRVPEDVELFSLPLFGLGFIAQVLPTLLAGGCVVIDRVFDPARAWALISEHRVTRAFLAPTMIAAMLDVDGQERFDASSLRSILVAYGFADRLREAAEARFDGTFFNMYGLTEAQLCCTAPGEFALDPTSSGKAMGLARLLILDPDGNRLPAGEVGEIAFQAPSVMSRYHGLEEATAAARIAPDTVRTGDLGYLDPDGNVHFTGRDKEIIKSGGFSIDPTEIENALLELPGVAEAAVVGAPDDYWGERVVACVKLADPGAGGEALDADALSAHVRERLARFKVPKEFRFLDDLPKNPTGKVQRGELRALVAG
jgi:acyl-CoA synthetase (AMP-forming)/AMP-acid ligase II